MLVTSSLYAMWCCLLLGKCIVESPERHKLFTVMKLSWFRAYQSLPMRSLLDWNISKFGVKTDKASQVDF